MEKKEQKLLTFNALGELSDRDFLAMNKQCAAELEEAQRELMELQQQRESAADFKRHIDTIRRMLQEAERDAANGIINKEFVERYIEKSLPLRRRTAPCGSRSRFLPGRQRTSI